MTCHTHGTGAGDGDGGMRNCPQCEISKLKLKKESAQRTVDRFSLRLAVFSWAADGACAFFNFGTSWAARTTSGGEVVGWATWDIWQQVVGGSKHDTAVSCHKRDGKFPHSDWLRAWELNINLRAVSYAPTYHPLLNITHPTASLVTRCPDRPQGSRRRRERWPPPKRQPGTKKKRSMVRRIDSLTFFRC